MSYTQLNTPEATPPTLTNGSGSRPPILPPTTLADPADDGFQTNREITEAVISTLQKEFDDAFGRLIEGMQLGNISGEDVVAVLFCVFMEHMNAGSFEEFLRDLDTIPDQVAKGSTEKMLYYHIHRSKHNIPANLRLTFKGYKQQIVYGIEMVRKDYKGEVSMPDVSAWIRRAGGMDQLHREWNRELTARSRKRRDAARKAEDDRAKEEGQQRHEALEAEAANLHISIEELQVRRRREKAEEIRVAKTKRNNAAMRRLGEHAMADDGADGLFIRLNHRLMKISLEKTNMLLHCASTVMP